MSRCTLIFLEYVSRLLQQDQKLNLCSSAGTNSLFCSRKGTLFVLAPPCGKEFDKTDDFDKYALFLAWCFETDNNNVCSPHLNSLSSFMFHFYVT